MKINANKLKILIINKGISQVFLAKEIGIHPKSLSYILRTGSAKDTIVDKIAEILRVNISDITMDNLPDVVNDPLTDYKADVEILRNRLIEAKEETIKSMQKTIQSKDEIIEDLRKMLSGTEDQKERRSHSG